MAQRKYSIAEIDAMRLLVDSIHIQPGRSYSFGEMDALVEDRLRTYMQNGTTIDELRDAAAEAQNRHFEAYRIMQKMHQLEASAGDTERRDVKQARPEG